MVAVYLFSFIGSGSHIVIIPLTDDSCVYMFSFTRSDSHIVIFLSLMVAMYICSRLPEVIFILLSFLSLMTSVYICSLKGSGSNIGIIPLTDDSCVYMLSFYRKLF